MRKKLYTIILFCLIVSSEFVIGKESKTKAHKPKSHKDKNIERQKRSLDEEDEKPFWANRGKKQIDDYPVYNYRNDHNEKNPKVLKQRDMEDEPFWGTRGRRDSASAENDEGYSENEPSDSDCNDCYGIVHRFSNRGHNLKSANDDNEPFWGVRGRRDSNKNDNTAPVWGNRDRIPDNDPFWGTRGRRKDEPFWGTRGRRDEEPFWGNRGRREESEPFWGNRGRRQESEPFWGNRGRRDDEPFWGNRGRRKEEDVFWGSRGRRKEDLKEHIIKVINNIENDIEHLSRLKKSEGFWSNRGRDSKLKYLFNGPRGKLELPQSSQRFDMSLKGNDPGTMTDSRIYADEPNYILVERSSRSSGEVDDPFFITRGKKYYLNKLFKAARDRRGALEDIVKSVRNDPYYIARGKKDAANATTDELSKIKELVCSAVEMIKDNGKAKREIDTDRDRRTILKKLTAQLQNDPYFVSRGKKNENANNEESLQEFVTEISMKCT